MPRRRFKKYADVAAMAGAASNTVSLHLDLNLIFTSISFRLPNLSQFLETDFYFDLIANGNLILTLQFVLPEIGLFFCSWFVVLAEIEEALTKIDC
ncbi:hypothetical protein L1887_38211 [Cichorium endivia]|nr:hypothetical protein L1887_38211 [Cichorium endivia]